MGDKSKIEWTDATWNPVTGCDKVSPGCAHCYAELQAARLQRMGQRNYANGFALTLQPHMLEIPKRWKRPRRIFVNSMSDLFHKDVPTDYIRQVLAVCAECPQHTFQILTKRYERLAKIGHELLWPLNVWMGVSVENDRFYWPRVRGLALCGAAVKFLSCEPLLGYLPRQMALRTHGVDWVIVGGESGPGARPIHTEWVRDIRDACLEENVAFYFKQWGGERKHLTGRELDGRTWDEFPAAPGELFNGQLANPEATIK